MSVLASDAFTDSDGTLLTSHSANWSIQNGGEQLKVLSNAVGVTATGNLRGNRYSGITWPNDMYSQATVVNVAASMLGVTVRCGSPNVWEFYFGGADANNHGNNIYRITKWIAGVESNLAAHASQVMQAGDVVKLSVQGTSLSLVVNGSEIVTATDSALTSGQAGILAFHSDTTTPLWDTWEGGDIAAPYDPGAQVSLGSHHQTIFRRAWR
jgi:hypothetical protein